MFYYIRYLFLKLIDLLSTLIVLTGGLPIEIQKRIKEKITFYPLKIMIILSALFEFFYGYSFFYSGIIKILNEKGDLKSVIYTFYGFFFVSEGIVRLGTGLKGFFLPILPIYILERLLRRILKYEKF